MKLGIRSALSKRPHVGSSQLKYQYDVIIHSLQILLPKPPAGAISVLWTRGSKTAITTGRKAGGADVSFEEQLTLICTLFREASSGPPQFSEKLCTFALIEQGTRGTRTLAKCKVDISPFAEVTPGSPKHLELTLLKGQQQVARLKLSIGSRWLKDYKSDPDGVSMSSASDVSDVIDTASDDINPADWADDAEGDAAGLDAVPSQQRVLQRAIAGRGSAARLLRPMFHAETSAATRLAVGSSPLSAPSGSGEPAARLVRRTDSYGRADKRWGAATESSPSAQASPPCADGAQASAAASFAPADAARGVESAACSAYSASSPVLHSCAENETLPNELVLDGEGRDSRCTSEVFSSGSLDPRLSTSLRSFPPISPHQFELHRSTSYTSQTTATEASDRARLEAERRDLEAQIAAAATLHKNTLARMEQERSEWEAEKASLRSELEQLRQDVIRLEVEVGRQTHAARVATTSLNDARAEAQKLKEEKEALVHHIKEVATGGGGDSGDKLASAQDLQGKLDRSEAHRQEVARKLGKARKNQQNLLTQYEAEIAHLAEKVEMLEDEVGDVMQEKLDLQSELQADRERLSAAQRELERQARRAHIQPAGVQDLRDQLEIANDVRATLCADIAKLTEELVMAKLIAAQEQSEREVIEHKLLRAEEKGRNIALRMTKMEVQLVEYQDQNAENDELKANAFMEAMRLQEKKIQELEEELKEARASKGWRWK